MIYGVDDLAGTAMSWRCNNSITGLVVMIGPWMMMMMEALPLPYGGGLAGRFTKKGKHLLIGLVRGVGEQQGRGGALAPFFLTKTSVIEFIFGDKKRKLV